MIQNFLKIFLMIYFDWCIKKVISMINHQSNIALFITRHKRKSCQIYCIPNATFRNTHPLYTHKHANLCRLILQKEEEEES